MSTITQNAAQDQSTTIGLTPAQVLAASTGRRYVQFHNPNETAIIAISFSGRTPAIHGLGTITLNPGGTYWNNSGAVASNAFNAISDTVDANLTIWEIPS